MGNCMSDQDGTKRGDISSTWPVQRNVYSNSLVPVRQGGNTAFATNGGTSRTVARDNTENAVRKRGKRYNGFTAVSGTSDSYFIHFSVLGSGDENGGVGHHTVQTADCGGGVSCDGGGASCDGGGGC